MKEKIFQPYLLKFTKILRIQAEIIRSTQEFLSSQGFYEVAPPIISMETDPGIRGANPASIRCYGGKYLITTSMNLQKFLLTIPLKKIFCLSPVLRIESIEKRKTHHHLVEFRIIEVESSFATYNDIINIVEKLILHIFKCVKKKYLKDIECLNNQFKIPNPPFKRITHYKAIEWLKSKRFEGNFRKEIPWKSEFELSKEFKDFFWILQYPYGSRGFYEKRNSNNPTFLQDMDLCCPGGYGEVGSGSEREYNYKQIIEQMKKTNVNLNSFRQFLKIIKYGMIPSAGLGLGLERLTGFICGLRNIEESIPFPKVPGIINF